MENPVWVQVSVYTWTVKAPVVVKQAVGLFLKENSPGSEQESVRSQFNGSGLDCIRTKAFGIIPVSSSEG